MPEWIIVEEQSTGMKQKRVIVYLENNNVHRQIARRIPIEIDVDDYLNENFQDVWNAGRSLQARNWIAAQRRQYKDLYDTVALAAVEAFMQPGASLATIVAAMDASLLVSNQATVYTKFKTMFTTASAAQKHNFSNVVSFLVMLKMASDLPDDEA